MLVDIEHDAGGVADRFADEEGAADIALGIARADLELDGVETLIKRLDDVLLDCIVGILEPADRGVVAGVAALENR